MNITKIYKIHQRTVPVYHMNSVYIHNYYIHHMFKLYVQTSCTHNVFFSCYSVPTWISLAAGLQLLV